MCGPDSPLWADPPRSLLSDPLLAHLIAKVAINQASSHSQQHLGSVVLLPFGSTGWCPPCMSTRVRSGWVPSTPITAQDLQSSSGGLTCHSDFPGPGLGREGIERLPPQGFCAHPPDDVTCPSPIIRPLPGTSVLLLSEWSGVVCTGGLFLLSYVWGRVLLSCLPCGGALSGLEGPSFPFPFGFSPKFFLVSLLSVWEASGPGLHTPLALWGVSLPTTPLSGLRLTSRGPGSCSCLALHSQSSVAYPPPLLSPAFFPGLGLDSFLPPACLFPSASASHSAPVRPTLGCSSYTHLALCSHHL